MTLCCIIIPGPSDSSTRQGPTQQARILLSHGTCHRIKYDIVLALSHRFKDLNVLLAPVTVYMCLCTL